VQSKTCASALLGGGVLSILDVSASSTEVLPEPVSRDFRSDLLKREMPGLDVLRGIAILSVFFFHGLKWSLPATKFVGPHVAQLEAAVSFGWLGVNLFFVLSGFLITGILIDTRTRENYWRSFYVRRALRILPLYLLVLVVLRLSFGVSWTMLALYLFYMANFTAALHVSGVGYGPLWSLAVEEQFYLVWPFVVRRLRNWSIGVVCVSGMVLAPILRALSVAKVVPLGDPYFATWMVCDNLFYGALIAVFLRSEFATERRVRQLMLVTGVLGAILAVVGFWFHLISRTTVAGAAFQPIPFQMLFTCMLLAALSWGDQPWIYKVTAPIRFYGYISYGFYMVHMMGFSAFGFVTDRLNFHPETLTVGYMLMRFTIVGLGLTLVCFLLRKYFEEYFLRFKDRLVPYTTSRVR
jgi:peptidoglycan/LPS O-acetylase OafA/YrhL